MRPLPSGCRRMGQSDAGEWRQQDKGFALLQHQHAGAGRRGKHPALQPVRDSTHWPAGPISSCCMSDKPDKQCSSKLLIKQYLSLQPRFVLLLAAIIPRHW
jgi:hypothetical protein